MRKLLLLLLLVSLPGCAGVKVLPVPDAGSRIDVENQSLVKQRNGVEVAVRLQDLTVRPGPVEKNICSFQIEIANQREVVLPLAHNDFYLIDDQGQQYAAYNPEELIELVKTDLPYLIPYPYVGYYYLNDAVSAQVDNQMRSERSYFPSRRPEFIKLDALPDGKVLPKTKVSGAVYFAAELRTMTGFELRYQAGAVPGQKSFPLSFRFSVEKD